MKEIIIEVPDDFGKTLKSEKINAEIKEELVRCKDCKFAEKYVCRPKEDEYKCTISESEGLYDYHVGNWFCPYGERSKENGTDIRRNKQRKDYTERGTCPV